MRYQLITMLFLSCIASQSWAANCLYISSYHAGYEWNDGIEQGIEAKLAGKCKLDKFYMDTKRNKSVKFAKRAALRAKAYIEKSSPDVIMACDDNASKYLIMPYYRDKKMPFVFCGINWTAKEYDYPYKNATGMIEVAPISPLLKTIREVIENPRKGVYLSADVLTEHKDYERYRKKYSAQGIKLEGYFAKTMKEWVELYKQAQTADFVILNNNSGINDWSKTTALNTVMKYTRSLTVTNYDWMTPYTMLAMTKLPEEQGEWAAQVALAILGGESPHAIPVVANRRWKIYMNPLLLKGSPYIIPGYIQHKAIRVDN